MTNIPIDGHRPSRGYNFTRWILRFPADTAGVAHRWSSQTLRGDRATTARPARIASSTVSPPDDATPDADDHRLREPRDDGDAEPADRVAGERARSCSTAATCGRSTGRAWGRSTPVSRNFRLNGGLLAATPRRCTPATRTSSAWTRTTTPATWRTGSWPSRAPTARSSSPRSTARASCTAARLDRVTTADVGRPTILRPRGPPIDGHSAHLVPRPDPRLAPARSPIDVDNDGDGVTDAVWLDLGYPATRNAAGPVEEALFAFTVIGLNGRIPLNTAGNLQRRATTTAGDPAHSDVTPAAPGQLAQRDRPDLRPAERLRHDRASTRRRDDVGRPVVRLTQLRNLLAGTRPDGHAGTSDDQFRRWSAVRLSAMPNNMSDGWRDGTSREHVPPVAGRWGEEQAVPLTVTDGPRSSTTRSARALAVTHGDYGDAGDDNFNTFDPCPRRGDPPTAANSPTTTTPPAA